MRYFDFYHDGCSTLNLTHLPGEAGNIIAPFVHYMEGRVDLNPKEAPMLGRMRMGQHHTRAVTLQDALTTKHLQR
ncbi:hypothetical protein ACFLTS_03155 [Chloroflexota bacterium]